MSQSACRSNKIPVRITRRKKHARTIPHQRDRVLKFVQIDKTALNLPRIIPRCLVLNARSLVKPDALPALYADLKCNDIDICCISETWLKPIIPDHLVCPAGFSIIRKDRTNCRGGDYL